MNWKQLLNYNRIGEKPKSDFSIYRSEFQRDFDRIIFSSAFRRLQDKTQVFPVPESDFVHNRLTHSIEVSSVGRSLGNLAGEIILKRNSELENQGIDFHLFGDIVAAASLAHDVGNPPFGHSGEKAISDFFIKNSSIKNDLSKSEWNDLIKYEGNAHGFRLLTNHHPDETERGGLKLTYATLAAFSKYPRESYLSTTNIDKRASGKKFGFFQTESELFEEVAKNTGLVSLSNDNDRYWSRHPLAFLMEAADNICYRIIDLEDGFKLKYLTFNEIEDLLIDFIKVEKSSLNKYNNIKDKGEKVGYLRAKAINTLVYQTADVFQNKLDTILNQQFDDELTNYISSYDLLEGKIKQANLFLYNQKAVIEIELAGYQIINGLLELYVDSAINPENYFNKKLIQILPQQFVPNNNKTNYENLMRIVDFVSRMSDSYAINLYKKLKGQKFPIIE